MPNEIDIGTNSGIIAGEINGGIFTSKESKLRRLIDRIILKEKEEEATLEAYDKEAYTIEEKIEHNCIDEYWREALDDFAAYDSAINETLDEDVEAYPKRSLFLDSMHRHYKNALKELGVANKQEEICAHSTQILDTVKRYYKEILQNDTQEDYDEMCVTILVAFGFCECKVLQKPH